MKCFSHGLHSSGHTWIPLLLPSHKNWNIWPRSLSHLLVNQCAATYSRAFLLIWNWLGLHIEKNTQLHFLYYCALNISSIHLFTPCNNEECYQQQICHGRKPFSNPSARDGVPDIKVLHPAPSRCHVFVSWNRFEHPLFGLLRDTLRIIDEETICPWEQCLYPHSVEDVTVMRWWYVEL